LTLQNYSDSRWEKSIPTFFSPKACDRKRDIRQIAFFAFIPVAFVGQKWFFETDLSDFLPLGATEPRHTEKMEDGEKAKNTSFYFAFHSPCTIFAT